MTHIHYVVFLFFFSLHGTIVRRLLETKWSLLTLRDGSYVFFVHNGNHHPLNGVTLLESDFEETKSNNIGFT